MCECSIYSSPLLGNKLEFSKNSESLELMFKAFPDV